MSLSKYYETSNSFQPEELIKREDRNSPGWQSLESKHPLPFQFEQLPEIPVVNDEQSVTTAENETAAEQTGSPADKIEPKQPSETDSQSTQAGRTKEDIDLSNFLELGIAEEKIAEAYQNGLQAGQEKAEQDFGTATRALLNTCQQLDTVRETIISNSSEELQEFALAIAEKIVRFSVREQDTTILATIEQALQRAVKSDEFTVYIHPEDYEIATVKSPELVSGLSGLNKIVIKKDRSIERGGAKIESDNCTVDATIASQLDVIREEIKRHR